MAGVRTCGVCDANTGGTHTRVLWGNGNGPHDDGQHTNATTIWCSCHSPTRKVWDDYDKRWVRVCVYSGRELYRGNRQHLQGRVICVPNEWPTE